MRLSLSNTLIIIGMMMTFVIWAINAAFAGEFRFLPDDGLPLAIWLIGIAYIWCGPMLILAGFLQKARVIFSDTLDD